MLLAERGRDYLRGLRPDLPTTILATLAALLAIVLTAKGIDLPHSGGVMRYSPWATYLLAPLVAALLVVRPWLGLGAWIVLLPAINLAQVQVVAGPFQLLLPTIFIPSLGLGWWLETRRRPWSGPDPQRPAARAGWLVAGAATVLTILSTITTPLLDRAVPIALHGMVEPMILGAIVVSMRADRSRLIGLLTAMGASVVLATFFNLVRAWVSVGQSLETLQVRRQQLARLTYYNVGIFGDMITIALPLLIGALLIRRALGLPRFLSWAGLAGIALLLVGLYLTFSKSGWLGGLLAATLVLVLVATTWRARAATVAVALVISGVIAPWPTALLQVVAPDLANGYNQMMIALQGDARYTSWNTDDLQGQVSITERLLATEGALQMTIDHPLLGVGPGGFAAAYENHYRSSASIRALDSAHDMLPYIAAEFGLPVALLVLATAVAALLAAWQAYRRAPPEDPVGRIVAAAILTALVGFAFVATTFGVDLYRAYRNMNSDVLYAALLVAAAISLRYSARLPAGGATAPVRDA